MTRIDLKAVRKKKYRFLEAALFFIRYSLTQLFYTRLSNTFDSLLKSGLMTKIKINYTSLDHACVSASVTTLTFYPNDIFSNPFTFVWSTKIHQEN